MNTWKKIPVTKKQIDELCTQHIKNKIVSIFGETLSSQELTAYSQIISSIFIRRNITNGQDILFYLEDDLRFQHSPFMFSSMEDAVERILQAKEENEKVLIFGDKDVDGITSTAILFDYLQKIGIDVQWRVPVDNDTYGLSFKAIDDFANEGGALIITVDCGISNIEEIKYANDHYLDVIITDHHNAPDILPEAIIILDPKLEDSGYPFKDISGAAVAYKLVSALRFAQTDFYNAEICLLDIVQNDDNSVTIDCLKIKNLTKIKELHEKIIPGKTSIYDLKLPDFLRGQIIYTWDSDKITRILKELFGSNIIFNLYDLRKEVSKSNPSFSTKTTADLQNQSLIARYISDENTAINSFYNFYVSYINKIISKKYPENILDEKKDLQLVALAAIADIMPLIDENRIFVKNGINSLISVNPRNGLLELFSRLRINIDSITAKDLSWTVTPALNASGRLGQADIALDLLLSDDSKIREQKANKIFELNEKRKQMVIDTSYLIHEAAKNSINNFDNKMCVIFDERIHKGLTGNFANRFMQDFKVPAIAFTKNQDFYIGSMRSCRGLIATDFLDSFGDFFINHGGHNFAAGFSFESSKLDLFIKKIKEICSTLVLEPENTDILIDAEIPPEFLSPSTFKILDLFEPYGCQNNDLIFKTAKIKIIEANVVGKKEPLSLKLLLDCGKYKFPAIFWGKGELLNKEIFVGEFYDILYNMSKNYFNGNTTPQFELIDIRKSL